MRNVIEEILDDLLDPRTRRCRLGELSLSEASKTARILRDELEIETTPDQIYDASNLCLTDFLFEYFQYESLNVACVYQKVKDISLEELHTSIDFRWTARWDEFYEAGNWLTSPDSYDFVETALRIEEELNVSIPDILKLKSVGQVIKYILNEAKRREISTYK